MTERTTRVGVGVTCALLLALAAGCSEEVSTHRGSRVVSGDSHPTPIASEDAGPDGSSGGDVGLPPPPSDDGDSGGGSDGSGGGTPGTKDPPSGGGDSGGGDSGGGGGGGCPGGGGGGWSGGGGCGF